jgi:hypothetical protein
MQKKITITMATITRFLSGVGLMLLVLSQTACNRDYEADVMGATPPAIEVVVKSATGQPLANTTVKLFNTEASWNAETGEIANVKTNGQGTVLFTEQQLTEPGFYFLLATDGTKKAKVKTKYFLRTDGKTRVNVTL